MIAHIRRPFIATALVTFIFVTELMTVLGACIAVHRADLIPANMSLVTAFCIPAVVSGIVASAHKDAVSFDFLCHGCDMLSDMLRDLIKRLSAHDPDGNGFPVIQG